MVEEDRQTALIPQCLRTTTLTSLKAEFVTLFLQIEGFFLLLLPPLNHACIENEEMSHV